MNEQKDYKVQLEVFEGPLDLLLYLIKKEEIDIYNIPIEKITSQYIEYIDLMKMLDLNIAGEFVVMAATLMMIKSRMLLPVEKRADIEDEEEEDPRWELVRQLVEYKKFKDAAEHLSERESLQDDIFDLGSKSLALDIEDDEVNLKDVSLFDLITAFKSVLNKAKPEEFGEIVAYSYTVSDKIDYVLKVVKSKKRVKFTELFKSDSPRAEIICTFLALLELLKLRQFKIEQSEVFGEIDIIAIDTDDNMDDVIRGIGMQYGENPDEIGELKSIMAGENENNDDRDIPVERSSD